jgi:hypothetical protein
VIAASVLLAGLGLGLAFWLGSWALDVAPVLFHQGRLRRLVQQHPRLDRATRALEEEGTRLVAAPESEEELRHEVADRGGDQGAVILEKAKRYPRTRIHVAGDMTYFLFFDAQDVLRDSVCACPSKGTNQRGRKGSTLDGAGAFPTNSSMRRAKRGASTSS